MAQRPYYELEEAPEYAEEVEQLLDTDPVKAQGSFFGSLILRILHNVKAVKRKADELTELVGDGLDLGEDDILPEERGGTGKSDLSQVTAGNVSGTGEARVGGIVIGGGDPEEMGEYSLPVGVGAVARGDYSVAVGNGAQASGKYAVAVGEQWNEFLAAQGEASLAVGYESTVPGKHSIANGDGCVVRGTGAWASGGYSGECDQNLIGVGDYSIARGNSQCTAKCSYVAGQSFSGNIDGEEVWVEEVGQLSHVLALGSSRARSSYSCAFNSSTVEEQGFDLCITALGNCWQPNAYFAAGDARDGMQIKTAFDTVDCNLNMGTATVYNTRTISMGEQIVLPSRGVTGDVTVLGCHTQSYDNSNAGRFVISGLYNADYAGDTLFLIGNGTPEQSGNAFRVDNNGDVFVSDGVYMTGADYAEYFRWADGNPEGEDRVGRFVTLRGGKISIAGPGDRMILGAVSGSPCVAGNRRGEWKGAEHGTDWDAVGCLGQLVIFDDGTCLPDGCCACGEDGAATRAAVGYRVLERVDEDKIRIWMR